jgi:hypothetical protein
MNAPTPAGRRTRDRTSQVVAMGLVLLALLGVATVFGDAIVAFVDPTYAPPAAPSAPPDRAAP